MVCDPECVYVPMMQSVRVFYYAFHELAYLLTCAIIMPLILLSVYKYSCAQYSFQKEKKKRSHMS